MRESGRRWPPLGSRVLLRPIVTALAGLFELARWVDPRFARAVRSFNATYELAAGGAARWLVFADGHARARPPGAATPDFRIELVDLPGTVRWLARHPDDVLRLQLENRVRPTGNLHYLFRLGYLLGLAARPTGWLRWPRPR